MDISIFPPTSTNLIVGTSNCGKTYFVKHVVQNFNLFFPHVDLGPLLTSNNLQQGGEGLFSYRDEPGADSFGQQEGNSGGGSGGGGMFESTVQQRQQGGSSHDEAHSRFDVGHHPPLPYSNNDSTPQYNGHHLVTTGNDDDDGYYSDRSENLSAVNIYVIHCNPKTPRWDETEVRLPSPNLRLIQLAIDEYELDQIEPNSLVIFDDVSALHPSIVSTVNVGAHHTPLLCVFVISQSIVGNVHYSLSKLVHRIIFCCSTSNGVDAANNIMRRQIMDLELRQHLQEILTFCHKKKTKFLLELNNLAAHPTTFHGFSHLDHLRPPFPYFLAYSMHPSEWKKKMSVAEKPFSKMDTGSSSSGGGKDQETFEELLKNHKLLPPNTMIVLPVECLDLKHTKQTDLNEAASKCSPESVWEDVLATIQGDIDLAFKPAKWREAKSLAYYILKCEELCVSRNGKFMWLKEAVSPRQRRRNRRHHRQHRHVRRHIYKMPERRKVNVLNFIKAMTRSAAPSETFKSAQWKLYRPIVSSLIAMGTPDFLLKNKMVTGKQHKTSESVKGKPHYNLRRHG